MLTGRAWSGVAPVVRVEVSDDGGAHWFDATVDPAPAAYAWSGWRATWHARDVGHHVLCVRATDASGDAQPVDQRWNRQAMANNHVQRVDVFVR